MQKMPRIKVVDCPSLLEAIRLRPMMYFGGEVRSIARLEAFLAGIEMAEEFYKISSVPRFAGFDWEAYEKWVKCNFNKDGLSLNSLSLAGYISNTESEGFDLWYSWYDEFNDANSQSAQ